MNRSTIFKVGGSFIVALLLCCIVGVLTRGNTPPSAGAPTSAPTVQQVTVASKPTTVEVDPTEQPTVVKPTEVPPEPTTQAEPTGALGMSRAAWEAAEGAPLGTRTVGEVYKNGVEATFMDNVLWRIDYWFPKNAPVDPEVAWDKGKTLIPADAMLVKTYQRDVTTVHLYHSEWLKARFPATTKIKDLELSNWPNGEPGDFTLQYNVQGGKTPSFIIGLGNNP